MLSLAPVALAAALAHTGVQALPTGAQVVSGQLSQSSPGAGQLQLNQGSARAIVDWKSFGIAAGESVRLAQPGGGLALFRVTGPEPSRILGALSASGSLFLLNPSGVYFGAGAQVDVGSLTASTLGLGNDDFLNGRYRFAGASGAAVENQGTISAARGGHIVLLGREVINGGTLQAPGGTVALGAAGAATLDLYGNGLLKLTLTEGSDGAGVSQSGRVLADGGVASFQALGASAFVNVSGLARASSLVERGGEIYLSAGPQGAVSLSGTLDASATASGGDGGRIEVAGERITLGAGSRLLADAGAQGHGGTVNAIATRDMRFEGRLSARGGAQGGDGGNAEVSGLENLSVAGGLADLSAAAGRFGTLLLDPGSVIVQHGAGANAGPNIFDDGYIVTQLGTASVTLATSASTNGSPEQMSLAPDVNITWAQPTTLTLQAGRNVLINDGAVISSTYAATSFDAIVINANQGATATSGSFQGFYFGGSSKLETGSGNIRITATGGDTGNFNHGIFLFGTSTIRSVDGNIELTGKAGASAGNDNRGLSIEGGNVVQATGRGSLTISGTGSAVGSFSNTGVAWLPGSPSAPSLSTASGALRVVGVGGRASAGIDVRSELSIDSTSGAITLEGSSPSSSNSSIVIGATSPTLGSAATQGNITITGDRIVAATLTTRTAGTVTFQPLTAGRPVNIGAADSTTALGLATNELDKVTAGTLQIGNDQAGTINLSAAFTPSGTSTLRLASAGNITQATTGLLTVANLDLRAAAVTLTRANSIGTLTATTTGAVQLNTTGSLRVLDSQITWGSTATTQLTAGGGLSLANTTITSTNAGATAFDAIVLSGNRGATASAGDFAGVTLGDQVSLQSARGNISLAGTGAATGGSAHHGVYLRSNSAVTTSGGNITVTGLGGSGGAGDINAAFGVAMTATARIAAGGSGQVTITGTGGSGSDQDTGVFLSNTASASTVDGALSITGTGKGDGAGRYNRGIVTGDGVSLTASGSGSIDLTGTGGSGLSNSEGVVLAAKVASGSGAISVTGTGGTGTDSVGVLGLGTQSLSAASGSVSIKGTGGSADSDGLSFTSGSYRIGDAAATGNVQLRADRLTLDAARVLTTGQVAVAPVTAGRAIELGGADSSTALGLSATELDRITAGLLQVGTGSSGALRVAGAVAPAGARALMLRSGSTITQAAGATIDVAGLALAGGDTDLPEANRVGTLSAAGTGTLNFSNATALSVGTVGTLPAGVSRSGTVTLSAAGQRLTLDQPVQSTAAGDAITLVADAFTNNAGAAALSSPNGRWRVFSADPASDQRGGLAFDFKRYDCVYNGACPAGIPATGNGFLYRLAPVLSVAPAAASSVYGDAPVLDGLAFSLTGFVDGDAPASAGLGGLAVFGTAADSRSPVGRYDVAYVSGLTSTMGYRFADASARGNELTVTARPVTLAPANLARAYGDDNPATAKAVVLAGSLANGDSVDTLDVSSPATRRSDVGAYLLSANAAHFGSGSASNYAINYFAVDGGLSVLPRLISVAPAPQSRVYGDANPASGAAVVIGRGLVNGDRIGSVELSTNATAASDVGFYRLSASNAQFAQGKASNYEIGYVGLRRGLEVTPRPLMVTPEVASRAYGDANPARAAARGDDLVNGDTLASVAIASAADAASAVGSYATTAGDALFATGSAGNYTIRYAGNPAGLSVTPRRLTITPDAVSRIYGDANPASATASGDNLVNGDTLASVALASSATVASGVGVYPTSASSAVFATGSAANYTIAYADNASGLTVTPRPLTITPEAVSRIYGNANPARAAATGSDLVNGDTLASVAIGTAATVASGVGSYATTASDALFASGSAANYTIAYADNASGLAITPRPLTITPEAVSRVYGNANPARTAATGSDLVNGDTLASVAIATPATVASGVGTYATTASDALFASGTAANYTIAYAENASGLAITPRPLTVTPSTVSRVYGNANPARATATGSDLVNGDTLASVAISSPATVASGVGTYATTASDALFASGSAANYTIAYAVSASGLTITPRPLTITPEAVSRIYGNANPARAAATGRDLVNGDTLASVAIATPATVASGVGSYATTASDALFATGTAANYTIAYADNASGLAITPRPLTVTPEAVSRVYGNANPARAAATGNDLVNGDTLASVAIATPATVASGVGTYATTASDALFATGTAANYTIAYAANASGLAITPRPLTVTPDAVSRVYGDANPARATATGSDLVNGDTLASVAISTPATVASGIGAYATTAGDALFASGSAANYTIGYAANAAGLAVTPRPIGVAPVPGQGKFAGNPDPALRAAVIAGNLVNGDALSGTLARDSGEAVGAYTINQGSLQAGANYALAYTAGEFTIANPLPGFTIDRSPALGSPASGAPLNFAPTAAGTSRDAEAVCVREQPLPGGGDARLVSRGVRLPPGVVDGCR